MPHSGSELPRKTKESQGIGCHIRLDQITVRCMAPTCMAELPEGRTLSTAAIHTELEDRGSEIPRLVKHIPERGTTLEAACYAGKHTAGHNE